METFPVSAITKLMKKKKKRSRVSKFSYQRFRGNLGVQFIASVAVDTGTNFLATPFKQNEV
jgi:hypothetical protein